MDRLPNLIIKDKELVNERFEVTDKNEYHFLGPNLTLRSCSVILKVPASCLLLDQVHFINCTFEVKQELKNHQQWIYAHLKGCRFKGRLSGCDFGYWPEYGGSTGGEYGFIEDCDFTEAHMNGCRIMGCDPRTLRFPKWPYFTILDPIRHAAELRAARWPGEFGELVIEGLHEEPARTRALTLSATFEAKRNATTLEAFKAVIDPFDFIVC